jgi:2-amino-4-hydroxy-6-hydroxymethyldihydropteridine diphosphokinase
VNAVAGLLTLRTAAQLLSDLQSLERRLGRRPSATRWGPRRIDLDLLVFGDLEIDEDGFTVPHPGIAERNFVVYPLAQVVPDLVLPDGTRLAMLRRQVADTGLQEIQETDEMPRDRR